MYVTTTKKGLEPLSKPSGNLSASSHRAAVPGLPQSGTPETLGEDMHNLRLVLQRHRTYESTGQPKIEKNRPHPELFEKNGAEASRLPTPVKAVSCHHKGTSIDSSSWLLNTPAGPDVIELVRGSPVENPTVNSRQTDRK